jgi:signal transduction histidine kinase
MRQKLFISIYTRFISIFLGVIFLSSIITFGIISFTKVGDIQGFIQKQLNDQLTTIKTLVVDKNIPLEEAVVYFEEDYIETVIFENFTELEGDTRYILSEADKVKLEKGEMVVSKLKNREDLPFGILPVGNSYLAAAPHLENNAVAGFAKVMRTALLIMIILGSVLTILAVAMIVKPIKEITHAAKEVSNGNFNISLRPQGNDEIAELTRHFNSMVKELKANEYLHKDFISSVSHEFKTPISSLKGFARLLKDKTLTEEQREECADIILAESERLSHLSTSLLRLSELDHKVIRHARSHFSLDEQIRRVILLLQERWEAKNLNLDIEMENIGYHGDEALLQQVWINLISNAIKFTPNGGAITVELNQGKKCLIKISDTGIGIAQDDKEKVFERFYKSDRARNQEGNGLGLSIVKKIVELHNGRVWVESEGGKGSTFFVEL